MRRWLATTILPLVLSACEATEPGITPVSPERARALYREHCVICHGISGDGQGPRRGSLYRKPPDFRREAWRQGRTPAALREVIRNGVPGSDMPAWRTLQDDELAGLVEYVLAFSEERDAR
jgi:mono/diheme cytochrome c family protein